ncbi:MAG TPA: hypothetical protein VGK20_02995 [Candidatus Binatia bacterium]|jgi:hypothetical protein
MRSFLVRGLVLPVVLSLVAGCAFTEWTDHGYFGSPADPPSHPNREWAGLVLMPLAVAGDILTAPAQLIMLAVVGDYGLYSRRNMPRSTAALETDHATRVASERGDLLQPASGQSSRMVAVGVDRTGKRREVALTAPQAERLLAGDGRRS